MSSCDLRSLGQMHFALTLTLHWYSFKKTYLVIVCNGHAKLASRQGSRSDASNGVADQSGKSYLTRLYWLFFQFYAILTSY